jgi:ferredoxin like protein
MEGVGMSVVVKVEEKLFQNRYKVDSGRPHISIIDEDKCRNHCEAQACTVCCPAACWTAEANGQVTVISDGCLECGTCRIVCDEHSNVAWEYPRGGYGILFKFG